MLEIKKSNLYLTMYDNLTEFSCYLDNRKTKPGRNNESSNDGESFSGTKSYEEAYNLFKYGDESLLSKIKREINKVDISKVIGNVNNKLKYEGRVYGVVPNVPIYLKGLPINMINPERTIPNNRIVNIILTVGVPWYITKEDIMETGAIYLNVLDLLEKRGYRVNLYVADTTESCGNNSISCIRVKTDREPLNLKKICFPIAHPSMLRRIFFRYDEVNDGNFDVTHNGYGKAMQKKEVDKIIKNELKEDYIIWTFVDKEEDDRHTIKDLKKIIKDLESQGINIE